MKVILNKAQYDYLKNNNITDYINNYQTLWQWVCNLHRKEISTQFENQHLWAYLFEITKKYRKE